MCNNFGTTRRACGSILREESSSPVGFIIVELAYAWTHPCASLQAMLDAFGLLDAAIFTLLGTVLGFYFASKAHE